MSEDPSYSALQQHKPQVHWRKGQRISTSTGGGQQACLNSTSSVRTGEDREGLKQDVGGWGLGVSGIRDTGVHCIQTFFYPSLIFVHRSMQICTSDIISAGPYRFIVDVVAYWETRGQMCSEQSPAAPNPCEMECYGAWQLFWLQMQHRD